MRSEEWRTPEALFQRLHAEFGFTVDACASPENALLPRYWTAQDDALKQDWSGECVYMNPPYGRRGGEFVRKAFHESRRGATVVCLLPASTDTSWWHEYCLRGEVRFLRGRLRFGHPNAMEGRDRAPFASAVVVFRPEAEPSVEGAK